MAILTPWTTQRPTGDDTPGVEQPNLTPDATPGDGTGDRVLTSHVEVLRDKIAYIDSKVENSATLGSATLGSHKSRHQNGGADEISIAGLSGEAADPQPAKAHASNHQHGGSDEVATATPANDAILKANGSGKLADGWLQQSNVTQFTANINHDNLLNYAAARHRIVATGIANPNAGAGTAGAIGDQFVDSVNGIIYENLDGTNTGWVVL